MTTTITAGTCQCGTHTHAVTCSCGWKRCAVSIENAEARKVAHSSSAHAGE